jgi:hypothetical protein
MNRIVLSAAFALAATPFAMHGADLIENPNSPDNLNRFSFGPTFGIGFKADFHDNANPGPENTPDANHTYNDGYVLRDSGTVTDNLTQNWNYQSASQYNSVYNTMQFLRSGPSSSATGNPQYGGEFIYQRVIGSLPALSGDWGLESGFGFTELDLRENLSGTAIVDSFQLPLGSSPPQPGNGGIFGGPQALLNDTAVPGNATLSGYQKLSGQLFSLRLGPFAELNFTPKLSLAASVGLTLAPTTVDYDFSEIAALAGGNTITENGSSSKTKLLYGPYVGGMLRYNFNKNWGVYVGARFQNLTSLDQSVGGRTARLDPSVTFYGSAGATWSF